MRRLLAYIGLLSVLSIALSGATARTAADWQASDPASAATIDHGLWERFLTRYVRIDAKGVHRVAYGDVSGADRAALDRYLASLAALPLATYNRNVQMAYWINLYNALLVRLVLEHYPVASVLDIDGSHGRAGPWDKRLVEIDGRQLSLRDIQNGILRAIWDDPRLHYALSCAALACPNLQPVPFDGQHLDEQLTEAAMAYINDPRCIQMVRDQLVVSSLFRWYQEDFGGSDRAVIRHLMAFAKPRLAMQLQQFDHISGDMFDWRLNDGTMP